MKDDFELQELNREIDLLLYTISHDLGAPLRAIDGFSQALAEDYGEKLDENGQDFIRRIRKAARQLDQYIDGVLQVSRATRGDLIPETIDLSEPAMEIVHNLQTREPERRVEIHMPRPLMAKGDRRLLRILLQALLDNAWKFTMDRNPARIEFGALMDAGQTLFFVRDNGVGFNMQAAEKRLFGLFQQMHSESRFAGLGTGLAIARRIINRHRGRIWAESQVNNGTVFYFSLLPISSKCTNADAGNDL